MLEHPVGTGNIRSASAFFIENSAPVASLGIPLAFLALDLHYPLAFSARPPFRHVVAIREEPGQS